MWQKYLEQIAHQSRKYLDNSVCCSEGGRHSTLIAASLRVEDLDIPRRPRCHLLRNVWWHVVTEIVYFLWISDIKSFLVLDLSQYENIIEIQWKISSSLNNLVVKITWGAVCGQSFWLPNPNIRCQKYWQESREGNSFEILHLLKETQCSVESLQNYVS